MWTSKRFVLILTGVILMGLVGLIARFFWPSKPVPLTALKFPVLVVREDRSKVFFETEPEDMLKMPMASQRVPIGGTIVIDSDFKMYTQTNIKSSDGEIATLFRALVRPGSNMTYSFDLMPRRESGLEATRKRILSCESLDYYKSEDERKRAEIAKQTTMAGIIAVLRIPPPDTRPNEDEPPDEEPDAPTSAPTSEQ